jgi:glycerol uptake facilitator-like aquaporin
VGSLLAAQFIAISARTPPAHAASSITTYWLAQQLGVILGVAVAALLSQKLLADALQVLLSGLPNSSDVRQAFFCGLHFSILLFILLPFFRISGH